MEQPLSTFQAMTLFLAAWGAVLSTILAIAQIKRERRSLKVVCRIAVAGFPGTQTGDFVAIDAVNTGHRPGEIRAAGLVMSNGHMFTQVATQAGPIPLPKTLGDGERVTVMFDLPKARLALRDADVPGLRYVRAFVHDAEGNECSSKVPEGFHLEPNPFFNRSWK